ncbi:MAG: carbohydrate kinase family protein [Anaerolineae bacterium]|nr:carbohydrate kinase family protein [Anaerolineae bacterium]
MEVLIIGAACLDVKGQVTQPLQASTSHPGTIRRNPGGVARNVAENLGRMGVEVTLISAIGPDWAGQYILEKTEQSGVDVEHVLVQPDLRSGTYLALHDQEGQLVAALHDIAALEAITPRYLNDRRRLFRDAQMVVIDSNLSPPTLRTVFRLAAHYERPVCADPTSALLAVRLRPFLSQLHMTTPNLEEAVALLGEKRESRSPIHIARRLVSKGVHLAVITLAERGLCYATPEESGHMPAIDVPIVDRTGVGDALTAAVIWGLLEKAPVSEAIRLGLSAAALTLQCRESVCPTLNLERLYDQLII